MRVNINHLRKRRKLVIEALKEKFAVKKTDSLFGSLNKYKKKVSDKEVLKKTMEMVASDAAKEGMSY
ncbi:MAG: hypothetical protein OD816_000972 [Thermodesulfobacterium sp.]|uniref:Uncharacterized protein n=1 Tax=Candidatus Thermodesulfobacterium syntrophicum TaxID=3060442 RepID=A0AAE3TF41_9BACT|nr:hypothetical protein [Candidatus Thermodesulfobacterium syntrophicum]